MDTGTLGQRIRLARERLGISQEELASRIARNQYSVSEYETGKRRIFAHDLPTLAEALEVPISYFFKEAIEPDDLEEVILQEFRGLASLEAKQFGIKLIRDLRQFLDVNHSDNPDSAQLD